MARKRRGLLAALAGRGLLAALAGFVLALVVGLVPGTTRTAWARQGYYGLWVGGVEVTEINQGDVLKEDTANAGKVRFTPANPADINPQATLTLSGASITTGYSEYGNIGIFYTGDYALNIVLEPESANSIEVGDSYDGICSVSQADVAILGTGSLSVSGPKFAVETYGNLQIAGGEVTAKGAANGVGILTGGDITITGGHLEASGMYGIYAGYGEAKALTIEGGEVIASGTEAAIYGTVKNAVAGTGWSDVDGTQDEKAIEAREEGQFLDFKRVQFPEVYPLWVGGVRVTAANKDDVLGDADEGATVTFAPATTEPAAPATLTLNGYTFDGTQSDPKTACGIRYEGEAVLSIDLEGENSVRGSESGIYSKKADVSLGGAGSVSAVGGSYGIATDGGDVRVEGAIVSANAGDADGGECGIVAFGGDVVVASGTVTAGNGSCGSGIAAANGHKVEIGDATVVATGSGSGIDTTGEVQIGSGATLTATGNAAISGTVKNAVPGAGWADVAALADRTLIAVSAEGQSLDFRRVEFPFVVVAHKVTAKAEPAEGGKATADPAEAGKGEAVKLYAEPADGYEFVKWSVEGAGASIDDATSPKATLTMGTADVTVTANFKKKDAPTPTPEPTPAATVAKAAKPKTVAHVAKGEVAVSWKAAKGAKSYQLQWRKAGAKKWSTASVKGRSKKVAGLKAGACYEFRVRGVSGKVRGKWSSASLRWLKGAAKAKAATGKAGGSVKATWKADKAATGGFKVFVFAKRGGKAVKTKVVKAGATSATVKGLKSGKTYYVRVRPYRAQGGSTYHGAISGYRSVKAK